MSSKNRTKKSSTSRSRKQNPKGWLIGAAVVLVVVVGAIAALSASGGGTDVASGPAAPTFALPGFDGGTVRLADFEGEPLVVNYWASWCAPCLAELPGFEQVYQKHRGSVAFLGINLNDQPEYAKAVVDRTGISYQLARDVDGSSFVAFGASGMPTTVFISADGRILELYTGDLTARELEARISKYFES